MSFQVGINSPGGVWQDTSAGHEAGKAVIAYTNPKAYPYLVYINTVGFLLSLTTILELVVVLPTQKRAFGFIRAGISWLTIMIMTFTYTFSVVVLAPTEMYKSINLVILATVTVWAVVISFISVRTTIPGPIDTIYRTDIPSITTFFIMLHCNIMKKVVMEGISVR
ncbi:hypothetical protein RHGRI_000180 [Rhododendron griersonianum]|uniref:PGG domain-containing protein n=1 Tax=Rhododendron griersonianum TaxID=479676 RepID=A0AAV6LGN6_9ERIC|nr:hypothetical protein RHGRI_000180 [Rhododendron griersonianum]